MCEGRDHIPRSQKPQASGTLGLRKAGAQDSPPACLLPACGILSCLIFRSRRCGDLKNDDADGPLPVVGRLHDEGHRARPPSRMGRSYQDSVIRLSTLEVAQSSVAPWPASCDAAVPRAVEPSSCRSRSDRKRRVGMDPSDRWRCGRGRDVSRTLFVLMRASRPGRGKTLCASRSARQTGEALQSRSIAAGETLPRHQTTVAALSNEAKACRRPEAGRLTGEAGARAGLPLAFSSLATGRGAHDSERRQRDWASSPQQCCK